MRARALAFLAPVVTGLAALATEPGAREPTPAQRAPVRMHGFVGELRPAEVLGAVTAGWDDAYADDRWAQHVVRLDGGSGRVVARIPVDGRVALGAGAGAVWALQSGGGRARELRGPLVGIDPVTDQTVARIPLRTQDGKRVVGFGVLAARDDVWVWGPTDVLRIDAASATVAESFRISGERGELTGAALAGRGLLASTADGRLVRFRSRTRPRIAVAANAGGAVELQAATGGRVVLTGRGTVAGIDPVTGAVEWRRRLGFRVGSVVANGRVLLVHGGALGDSGDRLWTLDARTGRLLASVELPAFGTTGLALVDGALWIACASGKVLVVPRWLVTHVLRRS